MRPDGRKLTEIRPLSSEVSLLKFAGVVNPLTIMPGNTVSSTQVADARMQMRGAGDIDKVQTTGWLTRFFLSAMPI